MSLTCDYAFRGGFGGHHRPLYVRGLAARVPEIHGRGTDGPGGSGFTDRAIWFLAPDLAFQAAG
jgi:hypothetical protein